VLPQAHSDRSSLASAHRIRIVNYIEAHLGDPDLTPMRVAQACKMTPRYLHHLFSQESETVARYILRRRLEECSRALAGVSQRGRTVTAIAFDYGFNSPTHFGRVFRARYGVTPREYRRQEVADS
jgi:AraC-like DNA-binding protein